jgi:hypothetical protein
LPEFRALGAIIPLVVIGCLGGELSLKFKLPDQYGL